MINATNDNKPQNTSTMPSPASTVTNSIPMSGETAKVIETLNTPQEPTEDRIDVMRGLNPEASHNPNPTSTTEVPLGSVPKTAAVPLVNSATMPTMDQFAKPTMDPTGSTMGQAASPAISPDLSASKPPAMTPAIEKPMTPSSPPAMEKPLGFDNRNDGLKPKKKFNIKMIGGMLVLLLIILGASAGFFLSQQTQDLRQQAYDGQPCNDSNDCSLVDEGEVCINNFCTTPTACIDLLTLSDCDASVAPDCAWYSCNNSCHPNGTPLEEVCGQVGDACDSQNQCLPPLVCHCQDGNACTIRECEDPSETEDWCRALNQDRWCLNQGGQAYTCCAEGYSCCSGYNGCCANNPPTTPPTTPPPTFSCNSPCATNAQCTNVNPDWTCDSNKCRLASNPTSITCEPEVVPPVCNGACTTTAECSAVNPDWICNGANKCVLASNPTSITCEPAVVPTSKTWNVTTSFICPDGSTPSTIGRRLFWVVWPPSPLTWYYNPILSLVDGSTTEITQAITVDNITPGLVKSVYVGLAKASDLDNFDAKAYKAINPPTGVTAATYFNPPTEMFNWSVINDTVPTNMTLKFEAPEELCEPIIIPSEPMCKDVAILDANNNELDPATDTFSIGMVLKFRCAADDPDIQITKYEFKVTEPNGTIVQGSAINPAGSSSTSQEYQITQYLDHQVQCRVCTGTSCQDWVSIIN